MESSILPKMNEGLRRKQRWIYAENYYKYIFFPAEKFSQ